MQLKRHIRRKHNNLTNVQLALKADKNRQIQLFDRMRKDGIFKFNELALKTSETPELMRERRQGQETKKLTVCTSCKGFFSKARFRYHKQHCQQPGVSKPTVGMSPDVLCRPTSGIDEKFVTKILSHLRRDDIGQLCQTDTMILTVGQNLYRTSVKNDRKMVMNQMRRLAEILLAFKKACSGSATGEDMLRRANFKHLQVALDSVTISSKKTLNDKRVQMGYFLRAAAKVMKGDYYMKNKEKDAEEMEVFLTLLEFNWSLMFGNAQFAIDNRRMDMLRRPAALPDEGDVLILRNYIKQEISRIEVVAEFGSHEFIRLRALLVARLTLFNARRGGEPSRLLKSEMHDAIKGVWLSEAQVEKVNDPMEQLLVGKFKLAYQQGKGKKWVPVLIPVDIIAAIQKLTSSRNAAGVHPDNAYLFPCTQQSLEHVSGSDMIRQVVLSSPVSNTERMTATAYRHRVSTEFSLMDVPQSQRKHFYTHMGHTEEINVNVYQCPPGITEVCKVGGILDAIDRGGERIMTMFMFTTLDIFTIYMIHMPHLFTDGK